MLEVELHGVAGGPAVDVAFSVEPGRCLALTGPSGAGKTTVLRMIAGLAPVGRGSVRLGGRALFDSEAGAWLPPEQRACGFVFQDDALFSTKNAWQNVAFGVGGRGTRRRAAAVDLLDRFGIGELADAPVASLSGGERQRVALARAVASEPAVLLLDEPLAALDVRSRAHAASEIAALVRSLEIPAVLVTHQFFDAALLGQEIAVIEAGSIVQHGSAGELAAEPGSAFVADFTGSNVLTGTALDGGGGDSDGLTVVELDGGGSLVSADDARGPVAVGIQPWEITIQAAGATAAASSARNALPATIRSIAPAGSRLRVGLALPQPLAVELTEAARADLGLRAGDEVTLTFKAAATRLYPR